MLGVFIPLLLDAPLDCPNDYRGHSCVTPCHDPMVNWKPVLSAAAVRSSGTTCVTVSTVLPVCAQKHSFQRASILQRHKSSDYSAALRPLGQKNRLHLCIVRRKPLENRPIHVIRSLPLSVHRRVARCLI